MYSQQPGRLNDLGYFVLSYVCQRFIEDNGEHTVPTEPIVEAARQKGWTLEEITDAVVLLGKDKFLVAHYRHDRRKIPAQVHPDFQGFDVFYRATVTDYDAVIQRVGLVLVDLEYGQGNLKELARTTGHPRMMVDHILEYLKQHGYIKLHRAGGSHVYVLDVSPSLKRDLTA